MGTASTMMPPSFENTSQALDALLAGAGYLADTAWAELPAALTSEGLKGLEYAGALVTVARTGALAAQDTTLDYELDGCGSQAAWLVQETGIDKGEARCHRAWMRRRAEHPLILTAIRDGVLSLSYARKLMPLTGRIPDEAHRREADLILVEAARAGLDLRELVRLAAEILARTLGPDRDDGQDFDAYTLRLETTLDGAGVLHGELSPECAAALQAVLTSLSEKVGPEDNRGRDTRMHDALYQACLRLLGTDLLPRRNGRPVQAAVHVGLADMLMLDDGSELQRRWTDRLVVRWAGQRAAALSGGGDGAAWLAGPSAKGIICDAVLFPIVTGDVDLSTLDDLLKTAAELNWYLHRHDPDDPPDQSCGNNTETSGDRSGCVADAPAADTPTGDHAEVSPAADTTVGAPGSGGPVSQGATGAGEQQSAQWLPGQDQDMDALRVRELMSQFIGGCVKLLSGEPGLAAYLRRNLFAGTALGGKSLPLDVGDVDDVPWWIRKAVATRDQGCTWPGGCDRPAWDCEPHHVVHRVQHGATAVCNLSLLCWVHHHVVIHRWGWDFKINGDGSTQATSPDGRVYRSDTRPPPARAG
jgi:hypothetical protein